MDHFKGLALLHLILILSMTEMKHGCDCSKHLKANVLDIVIWGKVIKIRVNTK